MKLKWAGFAKGHHRRDALLMAGGLALAGLTLAVRAFLPQTADVVTRASQSDSELALTDGRNLLAAGDAGGAMASLRQALELAETPRDRAEAGLAIGEILVERARLDPARQALTARQYLRAALAQEKREAERLRGLRGLLTVAVLRKDLAEIREACLELATVEVPGPERPAVLLQQLDALLESGDLRTLFGLLKAAAPYRSDVAYGPEVTLREARIGEQILERGDLFAAWQAEFAGSSGGAEAGDAALRAGLLQSTLAQFESVGETAAAASAAAARFHEARVLIGARRAGEARTRLEAILAGGPATYQRDSLQLLMDLARQEDRRGDLRGLVSQHVLRFGWTPAVQAEFLGAVDALEAEGQGAAALAFIERHLGPATSTPVEPHLLERMGGLARRLREYAAADGCYARLLALPAAGTHHPAAMLARSGIRVAQGDLNGAREWLFRYLNTYPYDRPHDGTTLTLLGALGSGGSTNLEVAAAAIATAGRTTDAVNAADLFTVAGAALEALELPQLAETHYRKAGLLRRVRPLGDTQPGPGATGELARIRLGQVRCLLAIGRQTEADRLLRRLCADASLGALRPEAVCLWAELALDLGQWRECERRLGLLDSGSADAAVALRIRLDRLAAEVGAGLGTNRTVDALLAAVTDPAAAPQAPQVRRAYRRFLEQLAVQGDADTLRRALEAAGAAALPPDTFRLQAARTFLDRGDLPAAAEWLKEDGEGLAEMVDKVRSSGETLRRYL